MIARTMFCAFRAGTIAVSVSVISGPVLAPVSPGLARGRKGLALRVNAVHNEGGEVADEEGEDCRAGLVGRQEPECPGEVVKDPGFTGDRVVRLAGPGTSLVLRRSCGRLATGPMGR